MGRTAAEKGGKRRDEEEEKRRREGRNLKPLNTQMFGTDRR